MQREASRLDSAYLRIDVFEEVSMSGCGVFDRLHLWMADNLGREDLCVELLASQMHMSRRNFARRYKASTGRTPAKTIEILRMGAARQMLEHCAQNIDQIACACGFGSEERMRATFQRYFAVSPRDYRSRSALALA